MTRQVIQLAQITAEERKAMSQRDLSIRIHEVVLDYDVKYTSACRLLGIGKTQPRPDYLAYTSTLTPCEDSDDQNSETPCGFICPEGSMATMPLHNICQQPAAPEEDLRYVITPKGVAFVYIDELVNTPSTHDRYDDIIGALASGDTETAFRLSSVLNAVKYRKFGGVEIDMQNYTITVRGHDVDLDSSIAKRIINDLTDEKDSFAKYAKLLDRLSKNPSTRIQRRVYDFLEATDIEIDEDGFILAYKVIRSDWSDVYTGTIDNSIGASPRVTRDEVDDDDERTCSHGLHLCSKSYLNYFYTSDHRVVLCKLDPADVVSIPADYDDAKLRCCGYTVIREVDQNVIS